VADFRKPRSLFFPLLLIAVGVLIRRHNMGKPVEILACNPDRSWPGWTL
jgi:hypothetical protein